MSVKFMGINELRIALEKKANMDAVRRAVKLNGAEMQNKAQRNSPVDTGTLKRGIGLEVIDGGLTAKVAASAEYAPYQEYGTRFMDSQPYMHPAFNEQKEQFKRDMKRLTD